LPKAPLNFDDALLKPPLCRFVPVANKAYGVFSSLGGLSVAPPVEQLVYLCFEIASLLTRTRVR
jgi:hypothetical protein